ncbi:MULTISPECIES: hypothetical protein [unclassified Schlesneria]|uniref:hypothetical protein n=1 Tax=Schlesneria TaxID=656899 RepID=UPI002F0BAC62
MPLKYESKSAEMVASTAESLKKATEQLTQVAMEMQQHKLTHALFPWTQRQWDCLDVIITMANQCVAVLPAQIVAKNQGRPSQYEIMQKRSKRDVAARKARMAATTSATDATPKKRGRPVKKKA